MNRVLSLVREGEKQANFVCAIRASSATKTHCASSCSHMCPYHKISSTRQQWLTYPSTNGPCTALGSQRTLSFTSIQGLVKATRDKKPFRFHILPLCRALSREHGTGPTSESRLQVNCARHKRNKTGIVHLNRRVSERMTYEACGGDGAGFSFTRATDVYC